MVPFVTLHSLPQQFCCINKTLQCVECQVMWCWKGMWTFRVMLKGGNTTVNMFGIPIPGFCAGGRRGVKKRALRWGDTQRARLANSEAVQWRSTQLIDWNFIFIYDVVTDWPSARMCSEEYSTWFLKSCKHESNQQFCVVYQATPSWVVGRYAKGKQQCVQPGLL